MTEGLGWMTDLHAHMQTHTAEKGLDTCTGELTNACTYIEMDTVKLNV